ncbi:hypothetical protein [Cupriavidus pauculus]|uniref:hypothetical protein n=1 Tax=Cupriavidus pauculus TaxID=82633 RepID=UPI00124944F1|nr:hypothetical protein [Cupriavidus pauculus]KAB0594713.1 hypothetical protein F7R19_29220 [Cupriavidus pauculus]UAK98484.1 hypothetical protein K8O84_10635 [Cupriavidus pauculus]
MSNLRLQLAMVLATIVMFALMLVLNEWLFLKLEFVPGINWVYLPAGMRLLCTLLFGEAGAVGLLIVSWLVCFLHFFPNDFSRAFMGGILATVAPYLAYKLSQQVFGLRASLTNLTPKRLLVCVVAYSVASPLLHHIWFFLHGDNINLVRGFLVMFVGDLTGTLIVIYTMKGLLSMLPVRRGYTAA